MILKTPLSSKIHSFYGIELYSQENNLPPAIFLIPKY